MFEAPKADGTVAKALQVLDQVAAFDRPVRFSELLEHSSFPKPTLYRFVQTLTNQGMLNFDADRQTYSMGMRLVRLAHTAWRQSSLSVVAHSHIMALSKSVGETVHLAQADRGHVLFVDKYKSSDVFETLAQTGKVAPAYCTGVGKAILAFLTPQMLEQTLHHQSFYIFTPNTHETAESLMQELKVIKAQGIACDREEHEQGIISIAAPIFTPIGNVIGAVSIATSVLRHSIDSLGEHRTALQKTAADIGAAAENWQFPVRA